jgi:tyrosyl-tRNA synthetase
LKGTTKFVINRDEKWGGPVTYTSFEDIENDFSADKVIPLWNSGLCRS